MEVITWRKWGNGLLLKLKTAAFGLCFQVCSPESFWDSRHTLNLFFYTVMLLCFGQVLFANFTELCFNFHLKIDLSR